MTSISSRRTLLAMTFLVTIMLSLSCKKDEPNPVGPPGGGGGSTGGSVSDSVRMVVLDSLLAVISQLPEVDRDVDNQTVLQYVRSRPEFAASGARASGVWGRFQDGRLWAFLNNLEGLDTTWPGAEAKLEAMPSPRSAQIFSENLPQNNGARIMNSLGSAFDYSGVGQLGFTTLANDIRYWHQQSGYTPVNTEPSVDGLKNVYDDGVFYCSAHGDTVPDADGNMVYGMWTSTEKSPALDLVYKNDLDSGRLVYYTAAHTKGGIFSRDIPATHYAITHKFVREYMSFGPHSVVYINGCLSANAAFRDACIFKGADLYLGYSNYVEAFRAARIAHFYFDRAFGAGVEDPVLSPPQKGYQIYDVWGFMYTNGLDYTNHPKYGRATLLQYPQLANVTMLRPLIYAVVASSTELRILGWFGENPGSGAATVKVGNTTVPIQSWAGATTIVCSPVQDGGDVVVSVRGRKSHPVPLTKFQGTFDYTVHGRETLTRHVLVSFEFLADVRTNRVRVDESPQWQLPRSIFPINLTGASFEASGEYHDAQGMLVESWGGSGSLPLLQAGSAADGVTMGGIIDKTGLVQSMISVSVKATYQKNGVSTTFSIDHGVGTLITQMNDNFVIPGDTYIGSGGGESAIGVFSNVTSTFKPTGATVR